MTKKLGIDRIDAYASVFKNKRVGLITNHTGLNQNLIHSAYILKEKTNLTTLFAPEHGIFGNIQAGIYVDHYFDPKLELKVYSLYGKSRHMNEEMLKEVDLIAYDIQDVGLRFYTYIYTMAYAMMAAQKYDKEFVVFDRPNPLGGVTVEGNLLDLAYRSFVGYFSIPQRYGLTVGELAMLFNEAFEIGCKLTVIPMEGYQRNKDALIEGYPWIAPSPNLPTHDSAYIYAATCLFEGTNISEGRGTTRPFQLIGAPFINADELSAKVNALQIPGMKVIPAYFVPTFSKHKDTLCQGIEILIQDKEKFEPIKAGYQIFDTVRSLYQAFNYLTPFSEGSKHFIDLLAGHHDLREGKALETIFDGFIKDEAAFKKLKERYHLYA